MEIREYAPVSYSALTAPVTGSLSDDSDTTYVELRSGRASDGTFLTDRLSCYFAPIDTSGFTPRFMHMMIRAKNPDGFAADPNGVTDVSDFRLWTYYYRGDDTTGAAPWDDWNANAAGAPDAQGSEFPAGLITAPTWYRFYYLNSVADKVIDPTVEPDSDHWRPVDPDMEFYAWDSLTGPGLRFDMYGEESAFGEPQRAWLDVYEVRLVVAGDPPGVYGIPPLRQVQRGDGRGFSTAPRFLRGDALRNFGYR